MVSIINTLVSKLGRKRGKIINNNDLQLMLAKITDQTYNKARIHKLSYTLKNKGYLTSLKKDCFLVTSPEQYLDEDTITLNYYRELLREHCQTYLTGPRYIGGLKALEFHLHNYAIPDNIEIINTYKNSLELIMFDKTISYKTYTHKHNDIFKIVKKYLEKQKIGKYSFTIASLELAMVESLHNPSALQLPLINEYIKRILRKHKRHLDLEFFETILLHSKHHVGVNRIYQISKGIDPKLSEELHTILKKYSFVM